MPKHVVIPDEREAKLRQIAAANNVTVADAVGLLITWAIEHGKVEPGLPGIDVRRDGPNVVIDFGDFVRVYDLKLAHAFAVALNWYSRPKASSPVSEILEAFSGAEVVGISRRGTSIKIAGDNGTERTLAPSIARELSEIIARTAAPK